MRESPWSTYCNFFYLHHLDFQRQLHHCYYFLLQQEWWFFSFGQSEAICPYHWHLKQQWELVFEILIGCFMLPPASPLWGALREDFATEFCFKEIRWLRLNEPYWMEVCELLLRASFSCLSTFKASLQTFWKVQ